MEGKPGLVPKDSQTRPGWPAMRRREAAGFDCRRPGGCRWGFDRCGPGSSPTQPVVHSPDGRTLGISKRAVKRPTLCFQHEFLIFGELLEAQLFITGNRAGVIGPDVQADLVYAV